MDRYARQTVFSHIGKEGQEKLQSSKVTIIGMGALGTVAANNLSRAGVGYIKMADRDYVELTNLQRQILYTEEDAYQSLPKVIAATNHLSKVNSEIVLDPIITDVNPANIEGIINDSDLVLDATDNFETRMLINEACHKHEIPWIYCGAIGGEGMTMNILPKSDGPCLRCFLGGSDNSPNVSCSTYGVLNMLTATMASLQTAEALKILIGSDSIRKGLLTIDIWNNSFEIIDLHQDPECPVCVHGTYEKLGKILGTYTTALCGSNSVQVVPPHNVKVNFTQLAEKLAKVGNVILSAHSLKFSDEKYEITLFKDGRAIIKNAIDGNNAKSVYTEYIGI